MGKKATYCVIIKKLISGRTYLEKEVSYDKRYMTRRDVIQFLSGHFSDLSNAAAYLNTKYKTVDDFLESDFYENSLTKNRWGVNEEAVFIARNTGKATNVYSLIKEAIEEKEKPRKKRKQMKKIAPVFRYDSVPYTGNHWNYDTWRDTHGTRQRFLDYAINKNGIVEVELEANTYDEKIHGIATNPNKYWGKHGRSMYFSKSWKKDKKCKRQWMKHMDSSEKNCIGVAPDFSLEEELALIDEIYVKRSLHPLEES